MNGFEHEHENEHEHGGAAVAGELGPGELGPGGLGPGELGPGDLGYRGLVELRGGLEGFESESVSESESV